MKIILLFSTNVAAVAAFNVAAACCSPRVHRSAGSRTLRHDDTEICFMTDLWTQRVSEQISSFDAVGSTSAHQPGSRGCDEAQERCGLAAAHDS